jgi:extradiol dioxygenase family protein
MLAVWHFSFTVSDLGAAVEFYVDARGCTCVHRQEQNNTANSSATRTHI